MKKCTKCGNDCELTEFYAKESRCKTCVNEIRRAKYKENPEIYIARVAKFRTDNPEKIRDTKLKQAYGVGTEYFNAKLKEQGGVCAGCGRNVKTVWRGKEVEMALDHHHETKQPRGVLCIKCNRALGLLEENVQTMFNLIEYANKYKKLR
jgi:ribosomal protein L34E